MATVYSIYNPNPGPVVIDDLPVPVTAIALDTTDIDGGNSQADVLRSILLRHGVLTKGLELLVNGKAVDYMAILRTQGSAT